MDQAWGSIRGGCDVSVLCGEWSLPARAA